MSVQVQSITTLAALEDLRASWNVLDGGVPFRSFDWLATWWKHYGAGDGSTKQQLYVLVVQHHQQPLAIAPWYVEQSRTRGRVVRWLGSGEVCSDHLSVLCRERDQVAVVEALSQHLRASDEWNRLELESIDDSDVTMNMLADRLAAVGCTTTCRAEGNCWSIDLPDSWEGFLAMLSKSHRKQLRKLDHRVLQSDRAHWQQVQTPQQLRDTWPVFVDLHQRRRESLGEPGSFASERFAAFHHDFAEQLLRAGRLRLGLLRLDGEPISAEYQFAGNASVYAYQGGFAPEQQDEQPGRLSLMASIQAAIRSGAVHFDLLRGNEPYKAHWRATARPTYHLRVLAPSHATNWLAQTADFAESLASSLKARLRPLVNGPADGLSTSHGS
ncbi:GNAT family N-acetyltransferase [Aeoliella mucimassa]|uniref:BioF2-like acetyltransferase domain-containing protein n=1 Tax=Aeoliella mucimassa TaxID=2527972 RepID=A0A518ANZ5_9BACT|nr:GNAT family N-acetyltransferase [Aeoliella mucimassa]QDU56448.1 hypothetical protein Pan181_26570 [Aeoliella mucimassa]